MQVRSSNCVNFETCANEDVIVDFFGKLVNILSEPMMIYNMDETGLSIVHRVIAELGRRNVWAITSAEKGRTHTILTCVSASGYALPPFMIYPRKRMADDLKVGALPDTAFHCSDSGWVTGELFVKWFHFYHLQDPYL